MASLHIGSTRQQRKQPFLLFEAETQNTGPCLLSAGQPVMLETKESRATRDSSGASQTFSGHSVELKRWSQAVLSSPNCLKQTMIDPRVANAQC